MMGAAVRNLAISRNIHFHTGDIQQDLLHQNHLHLLRHACAWGRNNLRVISAWKA